MTQESGQMSSASERELSNEVRKLTSSNQQQVTVNKNLSSKILILEKNFLDERRQRLDLEKKLAMTPAPMPDNKENGFNNVNTVDDLIRVQNQLNDVRYRVAQHNQNRMWASDSFNFIPA